MNSDDRYAQPVKAPAGLQAGDKTASGVFEFHNSIRSNEPGFWDTTDSSLPYFRIYGATLTQANAVEAALSAIYVVQGAAALQTALAQQVAIAPTEGPAGTQTFLRIDFDPQMPRWDAGLTEMLNDVDQLAIPNNQFATIVNAGKKADSFANFKALCLRIRPSRKFWTRVRGQAFERDFRRPSIALGTETVTCNFFIRQVIASLILALCILQSTGSLAAEDRHGASALTEKRRDCFVDGRSVATARDSQLQFIVRRPAEDDSAENQSGVILAVTPGDLAHPEVVCESTLQPNGIFDVRSIQVRIKNGPYYSGRSPDVGAPGTTFIATISFMASRALSRRMELGLRGHSWLPRGEEYGLKRYEQFDGVKAGHLTKYSSDIGPYFVGTSNNGHFVMIDCVYPDLTKIVCCQMRIAVADTTMIAIVLPTENFGKWAQYASAAEMFFRDHLKK